MKNKFLIAFLVIFASLLLVGTSYSAWISFTPVSNGNAIEASVPEWIFGDIGFAKIGNVNGLSYLTATKEETLTQGSSEAVRFTNTAGTQGKDHVFYINLDKDYYLFDIDTCKIEFDLYHKYKREHQDRGFPKLQLYTGNTARGRAQGGDETITDIAPYTVTNIDEDWWHLEYYIVAMAPTMTGHTDTAQGNYKVNRIKFVDRNVYDFNGTTGYFIVDNLVLTNKPGVRIGLFNNWTGDAAGKFFWFKVAWSGDLHSCNLSTSDSTIAVPEFEPDSDSTRAPFPDGSPFYVKFLSPGNVTITATVVIGDEHLTQTISKTFTVT